jgi:hypothetical protein
MGFEDFWDIPVTFTAADGGGHYHHAGDHSLAFSVPVREGAIWRSLRLASVRVMTDWLDQHAIETIYKLTDSRLGQRASAFVYTYSSGPTRDMHYIVTIITEPTVFECATTATRPRWRAKVDPFGTSKPYPHVLNKWLKSSLKFS